ncbi:MAG: hypothetical protein AAGC67_05025 [Myxococcota bacterium]
MQFEPTRDALRQMGASTERLFRDLPAALDLRDERQLDRVLGLSDELLARVGSRHDLDLLEAVVENEPERWPIAARLVVKLARSRYAFSQRPGAVHLSVVVPLYGEHERIQRPSEHPLGEGFLDRKIRQLDWLVADRPDQTWDLLFVDDGCPFGSGHVAESILAERHEGRPARVLHLDDAIRSGHALLAGLDSSSDSQKGGAVHLGLWESAHGTHAKQGEQIVAFTDADLSTHLGQLGLLVDALDRRGTVIAAGTRRARTSAVVKPPGRSARGRLFIYLWKKLLPELAYLDDTQCGFKAMRAEHVGPIVAAAAERGFAFDLELLLRSELICRRSVTPVPIAWIDSEDSSNTASTSIHLSMLRRVVSLARSSEASRASTEAFAKAIDSLDEERWQSAIEQFGARLESIDPRLDGEVLPIRPADLIGLDPDRTTVAV